MLNHIFELYSRCGESLMGIGLNDAVLPLKCVDKALDLFLINEFLVLGGDLYIKNSSNHFECFYADWFYEGLDYIESIKEARNYLVEFKDKDVYVSFVLK